MIIFAKGTHYRSMESHQSGLHEKSMVQGCNIAEPDKRLWMVANDVVIEERKNSQAAIATTGAHHGIHRLILEDLLELGGTLAIFSRQIPIRFEQTLGQADAEAHVLQYRQPLLQLVPREWTGRGHYTDGAARLERSRFDGSH